MTALGSRNVLVKFRLDFDNVEYIAAQAEKKTYLERIPLPNFECFLLLKLFEFGIIFGEDMKLLGVGEKLIHFWGTRPVLGDSVVDHFKLRRPKGIPFTWKNVSNIWKYFLLTQVESASVKYDREVSSDDR